MVVALLRYVYLVLPSMLCDRHIFGPPHLHVECLYAIFVFVLHLGIRIVSFGWSGAI